MLNSLYKRPYAESPRQCQRCQKIVEYMQGTWYCNKCESERARVNCKGCRHNVTNFSQLECGNHFVCEKCSIANYFCWDCFATCDQCKNPSYTIVLKANCDHTICDICWSNGIRQCTICECCNLCDNLAILSVRQCGQKHCKACVNNGCKICSDLNIKFCCAICSNESICS